MKNRYKKIVVTLTCIFIIGTGVVIGSVSKDFNVGKNLEIFFNVFKNTVLMYVDDVDPDELVEKASNAMLSTLDPYTEYMSEEKMKEFEIMTTGKYAGTGAMIRKDTKTDYIRIAEIYKDFPAYKAGLKPGDMIISIDGVDMKGATTNKVSDAMKGEPGSSYKMEIKPLREDENKTITIKRERISISSIPYYGFVSDGVGYIILNEFSEGCGKEFKNAFNALKAGNKMHSLIIDLRNNGGGLLQESINIIEMFVPKGTEVVSTKGKNKSETKIYKTNNNPLDTDIPIAVLVNSYSASSSEILAGALQDLDRAVIIGNKTFGKGLIQTTKSVGYGSFIKITTAKYYIPSGRCIQALDYSKHNKNGEATTIADSLRGEFKTKNGRKVYDGGGVAPDVKIEVDTNINKFVISVVTEGYIDDFAIEYFKTHTTAVPINYSMSDDEYDMFCEFIGDKKFEFKSGTEILLEDLIKTSKKERYYKEIEEQIASINKTLNGDRQRDLDLNKEVIKEYLESAIVTCYHYNSGRVENIISKDKDLKEVIDILKDKNKYDNILKDIK